MASTHATAILENLRAPAGDRGRNHICLGTDRGSVRGVLDVGTGQHLTVLSDYCGADMEIRIGGISSERSSPGSSDKFWVSSHDPILPETPGLCAVGQQRVYERLRLKSNEIVNTLTYANEFHGYAEFLFDRDGDASPSGAIHLG